MAAEDIVSARLPRLPLAAGSRRASSAPFRPVTTIVPEKGAGRPAHAAGRAL